VEPPQLLDLAFIDADKPGYDTYYELLLPKMKPNGLFIFDNMVWGGRVIERPLTDPMALAIDRLNEKLATEPRWNQSSFRSRMGFISRVSARRLLKYHVPRARGLWAEWQGASEEQVIGTSDERATRPGGPKQSRPPG